jgi:REP-associated tyrosine transposase
MPRIHRVAPPGLAHHVINRGNNRACIFRKSRDYQAFLAVMQEAQERVPMRLLAYALMPNHFHLVLWPESSEAISAYMRWLMNAHIRRYQQHYGTCGHGHLYQGRFKNFPIQRDAHLLRVLRYVEANPLRAGLVGRAEEWTWSSLTTREGHPQMAECPVSRPVNWLEYVNGPASQAELTALRASASRGAPYGEPEWVTRVAGECGLAFTLRTRGRQRRSVTT